MESFGEGHFDLLQDQRVDPHWNTQTDQWNWTESPHTPQYIELCYVIKVASQINGENQNYQCSIDDVGQLLHGKKAPQKSKNTNDNKGGNISNLHHRQRVMLPNK